MSIAVIMMTQKIDMINEALVLLGERPLSGLQDNHKAAQLALLLWERACLQEWSSYPWRIGLRQINLYPLSEPNHSGSVYLLPSDCFAVRWLENTQGAILTYQQDENKLYLPEAGLVQLTYLISLPEISLFPSLLVQLISVSLAQLLCESLTQSPVKHTMLAQKYADILLRAKASQAFMVAPIHMAQSNWIDR